MRHFLTGLALVVCAFPAQPIHAQSTNTTLRYPRVIGPTGRPYGPTQAHYQYQRRYGRPWHGQGGLTARYSAAPAYGYRYAAPTYFRRPYGWGGCYVGPPIVYPYPLFQGLQPNLTPVQPGDASPEVYRNPVLREAWIESQQRWRTPLGSFPKIAPKVRTPSSPDAMARSARAEAQGDQWFRQQRYSQAYDRYDHALELAEDRAAAWFRKALTLAALGNFDAAARSMRRALEIDPDWPMSGQTLDGLFGPENVLAKTAMLTRIGNWVHEDIRDPDRLFLMGALLHFDGYGEKSRVFFESALRLAGYGDHLIAFLQVSPGDLTGQQQPAALGTVPVPNSPPVPDPNPQQPPVPQDDGGFELPVPPIPGDTPGESTNTAGSIFGSNPSFDNSGPALLAPGE